MALWHSWEKQIYLFFLDFECRPTPLHHNSINKGSFGTVCCFWPATARLFFQSFNIRQVAAIGRCLMSLEPRQNSRSAVFSFDSCALFCFASSLSDQRPHPVLVRRLHNAVWMFSQRSQRDLELQHDPLSCQRCWMLEHFGWMSNVKKSDETPDISWHQVGTFLFMQNLLTWISAHVLMPRSDICPELFLN